MARNPGGNVLVNDSRISSRGARRKSSPKAVPGTTHWKSESRRELILATSTTLFCENGFHATTVREIADEVGMQSGSIYHHFDSKEHIFEDIIRTYVSEKKRSILSVAAEHAGLLDVISAMSTVHIIHVVSNSAISKIISYEWRMIERLPQYQFVMEAEAQIVDAWRDAFQSAVRAGKLHPDMDCGLIIGSIMSLINNALSYIGKSDEVLDVPSQRNLDHVIDQIIAIVFGMMSPWMMK